MPDHIYLTEKERKILVRLVKKHVTDSTTDIVWENVAKQFVSDDFIFSRNANMLRKCWEAMNKRKNAAAAAAAAFEVKEEPVDDVDDQAAKAEPEINARVGLAVDALMAMGNSSWGNGAAPVSSACTLQLQREAVLAVAAQVAPETSAASESCAEGGAGAVTPKASGPPASQGLGEHLVPQPQPQPEGSAEGCPSDGMNARAQNGTVSEEEQDQEDEREGNEDEDGNRRTWASEVEHKLCLIHMARFFQQQLHHDGELHRQRMRHREELHRLRVERRRSRYLVEAPLKTCS